MKRFLCYCLAIPLFIIAAVILLLTMPAVNLWLAGKAVEWTPGLSIQQLQGSVFGKLTAKEIDYQSESLQVNLDRFHMDFDPSALLTGVIQFQRIDLAGLEIKLYETREKEQGGGAFVLPIPLQINEFGLRRASVIQGKESWLVDRLTTAIDLKGQDLILTGFQLQMLESQLDANGSVLLAEPYPFDFQLAGEGPVPELGTVSATMELNGDSKKIEFKQQMDIPYSMHVEGSILLDSGQPVAEIRGTWKNLHWPSNENSEYFSKQGRFTLEGPIDDYLVDVQGDFHGVQLPAGRVSFNGRGNQEQLTITQLLIETLNGEILTQGWLNWNEYINWQLNLSAFEIHTDDLFPDYPGVLNLETNIRGDTGDGLNVEAQIESLHGTLRGIPLQGSGNLGYTGDTVIADRFKLSAGDNTLTADGRIGSQSALEFFLAANDLSMVHPDFSGKIHAKGSVKGNVKAPKVEAGVLGSSIVYEENQLETLKLEALVDFSGQGLFSLFAEAGQIHLNDARIDRMELQGIGNFTRHAFNAAVDSESGNLTLAADGSYLENQKRWKGKIEVLDFDDTPAGSWSLNKAAQLDVFFNRNDPLFNASEFCLYRVNDAGKICLEAERKRTDEQWIKGTMNKLPFAMLSPWLPENIEVESSVSAAFDLRLKPELTGNITVEAEPGVVNYHTEQRVQAFPFRDVVLNAKLSQDVLDSRFSAVINEQDTLVASVKISSLSQVEKAKIDGKLEAKVKDLSFMNLPGSPVREIRGELFSKVRIEGRLSAPKVEEMDASLKQAEFTYYDLGLEVRDLNLTAKLAENGEILLAGSANMGGETAHIEGRVEQGREEWSNLQLTLKGERLKVVQLPEMEIWASPDLAFSANPQKMDLTGKVAVPKAIFTFEELPENAVNVSSDEVIVSSEPAPIKERELRLTSRVEIELGDEVSLQGFGLDTKLKGDLRAVYESNRFRLFNQLNLVGGVYSAYGQELKIDKGHLLFQGAIDDPGIDLLASRKSRSADNVVAYFKMTGTLKKPLTSIYTQPATSESEALAYLLTGYPLKNAGEAQTALLASAAALYGQEYTEGVMAATGIDELTVGSTRAGENSLIAGKKITPRLYARYITDVITAQMLFAVEYKLTDHFSVEASSGNTHGVDLKYKIEFD